MPSEHHDQDCDDDNRGNGYCGNVAAAIFDDDRIAVIHHGAPSKSRTLHDSQNSATANEHDLKCTRCRSRLIDYLAGMGMRPILFAEDSVNQSAPSGPDVIRSSPARSVRPVVNSVAVPPVVMRPMRLPPNSVNHSAPSEPDVMPFGPAFAEIPFVNTVTRPPVVMRATLLVPASVNQSAPSEPEAIPEMIAADEMPAPNSVTTPPVVIRA